MQPKLLNCLYFKANIENCVIIQPYILLLDFIMEYLGMQTTNYNKKIRNYFCYNKIISVLSDAQMALIFLL